ncbi:MAG: response regulator [Nitrospiraceae bacterium]|nr:response regulator [Nitrospiraceae bacterium]
MNATDAGIKNILLVDDEKSFLLSLAEGLKDSGVGLGILTAENGRQALEAFRAGSRIDLLVTDLKMPEMNGFELLASVEKDFPGTRVIVLTAFVTPEIDEQLKAIRDYVCIEKPVEFDELRRRIMYELGFVPGQGEMFGIKEDSGRFEFLTETYLAP